MAREVEATACAIHPENGDIVTALIATIEELAAGIEIEAPRITPAGPFFAERCEGAVSTYRKDRDAVVQPVAGIDKPAVGGNQDLGAEISADKSGRKRRNSLASRQSARLAIEIE